MIIKVNDVMNKVNNMKGAMYIHAYTSDESGNTGLVFHFQQYPLSENEPVFVINYVLLESEEKALREMTNLSIFDIGYALKCNNGYIDMFKFGRHNSFNVEGDVDTPHAFRMSMVEQMSYEFDIPSSHWLETSESVMIKEWNANNKRCGFPLCISRALKNPNSPTVYGGIVPSSLDTSIEVMEIDYNPMPF